MTYRRRKSGSSPAPGHDIPGLGLDLELPKAEIRILARLRGCNVPEDGRPIEKEAVT